jgi:RNA polymerase sigma-70 factor, ECF subfamily
MAGGARGVGGPGARARARSRSPRPCTRVRFCSFGPEKYEQTHFSRIVQSAGPADFFARAWLTRQRFRDEANGSACPWLFGIANNLYRDWLRRRRVETSARQRLGLPELRDDPDLERVEERLSLPADALEALASLPHADRDALELRVVEDRSYSEVASRLKCTPQAARSRVSRALRRLHADLKGDLGRADEARSAD